MAEFQNGMAGGTAKGLTQVLGESKNEDVDFENMVQRLMKADFDDWPNEAGVSIHHPGFNLRLALMSISVRGLR